MDIALDARIRDQLHGRGIEAETRQRHRCGDIGIFRVLERGVARAAEKYGTWFGISSLGTVSIEEVGEAISTPKMFQLYVHKDKGLNASMTERCKASYVDKEPRAWERPSDHAPVVAEFER